MEDSPSTRPKLDEFVDDGKNKGLIVCQHCPSKILHKGLGVYKELEFSLPYPRVKAEGSGDDERESIQDTFEITDMYSFENIGFSKTVGNLKYLICADCEMGPIGWHNTDSKLNYIALSRIKLADSP